MALPVDSSERFEKLKSIRIEQFKQQHPTVKFKYGTTINHKFYRLVIKKIRRQLSRQTRAQQRDEIIRIEEARRANDPLYQAWLIEQDNVRRRREVEEAEENERARQLWEQREQMEIDRIKQLIIQQEHLKRKAIEQKQPVEFSREIQINFLQKIPSSDVPTHNPFPPVPSIQRPLCAFFLKTGVCRFNGRCHRIHNQPGLTNTLLAVNMYSNFEMQYGLDDEYDVDIGLEFEESERYQNFQDFYYDVLPEFERHGRVMTFKVCSNSEIHLRGNVYVEYETEDEAIRAYRALNTRYYAGRMVQCQFVHIPSWTAAICGLFQRGKCPKGRRCNYLHVFRNPPVPRPIDPERKSKKHKRSRSNEKKKSHHHRS